MTDDSEPAFPTDVERRVAKEVRQYHAEGMSLMDYFAAKAMASIITQDPAAEWSFDDVAKRAYLQAASMLKAKELI